MVPTARLKMKSDHVLFDLEQQILKCWNVVEDIKSIRTYEKFYTNEDKLGNVLCGLEELYEVKFEVLFSLFEQMTKEYWELKNGKTSSRTAPL